MADRYLMGKLPAEERLEFEEHFLDCRPCVESLEALEGLADGLRALTPRTASTIRASSRAPVPSNRERRWSVLGSGGDHLPLR